jgi:hypothetical protein
MPSQQSGLFGHTRDSISGKSKRLEWMKFFRLELVVLDQEMLDKGRKLYSIFFVVDVFNLNPFSPEKTS